MDLARELTLESRYQIEKLMRLIAPAGVAKRTVHQFLNNEMPIRVPLELRDFQHPAEVLDVAMKVADDKNVIDIPSFNEASSTSRRTSERFDSLLKRAQETDGIGHNAEKKLGILRPDRGQSHVQHTARDLPCHRQR